MFAQRRWRVALGLSVVLASVLYFFRFIFSGYVLVASDYFRLFIPESSLLLDYLHAGELPLWNPYARMGQPFAASLQAQAFYLPRALCVWLFGPALGMTVLHLVHAAWAALGVTWLMSRWSRWAPVAWVAGLSFGLSPMFTSLDSANLVAAASWSGWVIGAAVAGRWRGFAIALAGSLLAASPETTLWQLFLSALLVRRDWRFPVTIALGFGAAAITLLPAVELTAQSIRGTQSISSSVWSLSWPQLAASVWPMFDLPRGDQYWGDDQRLVTNLFLGTLTVLLAALGVARGPRVARRLALGGFALLLFSLGSHIAPVRWLLEVPPFNWFRYPVKAYLGAAFCVAVLAGFGLDAAARLARRVRPPPRWAPGVVAVVVLLRMACMPLLKALPLRMGAVEGSFWPLAVVGVVAVALCLQPRGWRRARSWRWTLGVACVGELFLARERVVQVSPDPLEALEKPSVAAALLPRPFTGRVSAAVSGASMDFPPDGGEFTVMSRDLLVPVRFIEERVEAIDGFGPPEPVRSQRLIRAGSRGFADLAGVTHYLSESEPPFDDLTRVAELQGGAGLFTTTTALPRAFVVQTSVIATDEEALRAIEDPALEQPFRHTVFLASGAARARPACPSEVTRVPASLLQSVWEVTACDDGFLVVTESYFPGWRARVDGVDAEVLRADYAFRAVEVSAGRHRVELSYRPASFTWGVVLTVLSLAALAAPGLASGRRRRPRYG